MQRLVHICRWPLSAFCWDRSAIHVTLRSRNHPRAESAKPLAEGGSLSYPWKGRRWPPSRTWDLFPDSSWAFAPAGRETLRGFRSMALGLSAQESRVRHRGACHGDSRRSGDDKGQMEYTRRGGSRSRVQGSLRVPQGAGASLECGHSANECCSSSHLGK